MKAFPIKRNKLEKLLELFEQLEAEGVLVRQKENNLYVLWRFDLLRFDGQTYCAKCYSGKRGYKLYTTIPGLQALVNAGTIRDIKNVLSSASAVRAKRNVCSSGNPYGRLERILVDQKKSAEVSAGIRLQERDLSKDQTEVFQQVLSWVRRSKGKVLKLGGYAGTGKTTLIALLANTLVKKRRVAFCAFAGKAANVLRQKLRRSGVNLHGVYCGTIHGLIYHPLVDDKTGKVTDWILRPELEQDLLVIDEASMVGYELWKDLLSYEVPILAVGDHGQLPPVSRTEGKERQIYLMEKPDLLLERIHRQAEANPIIRLATHVRKGAELLDFETLDNRIRFVNASAEDFASLHYLFYPGHGHLDSAVLCFTNSTRVNLNLAIRRQAEFAETPLCSGETVICLRNNRFGKMSIFNGMRGRVEKVHPVGEHHFDTVIDFVDDGLRLEGRLSRHQFGRSYTFDSLSHFSEQTGFRTWSWEQVGLLFDYGYALTVHKAQGSQFAEVIMVAEDSYYLGSDPEYRKRWLYTAITRAVERITIMVPKQ
ncbi:MAG: AAA family ATPase [Deltaproteobacteria bacterium]|nr:AAA family ATPase [Deltaproteobacteria bacterium]